MKLNLRIPHEQVKTFDIDLGMSMLVMGTTAGNVYVYDLAKAIENERVLARKRIEMGVEEDLVITKLQKATMKEVQSYIKGEKVQEFTVPINTSIAGEQENFDKYLPSFLTKEEQTQPMPEGLPIFTERSTGSALLGGTQLA